MPTTDFFPYWWQLKYTTAYAPHTAEMPLLLWTTDGAGNPGFLRTRDAATVPADTTLEDFIDLWKVTVPSTHTFVYYTIFHQPTIDDLPLPVFEKKIAVSGTGAMLTGDAEAWQAQYEFRTSNYGLFKPTLLDVPNADRDGHIYTPSAAEQDVIDYIVSDGGVFAGRDGGSITTFRVLNIKKNDRLRRSYGI